MTLIEAARAVVTRWDSPDWKDGTHTAEYIDRLRAAIEEAEKQEPVEMPDLASNIVNDAAWAFIESLPHKLPPEIFNDLKPAIYAALIYYHRAMSTAPQPPQPSATTESEASMSDQQTEALRLADALTGNASGCICGAWSSNECGCSVVWPEDYIKEAATELRRLVAENERLREFEREVVALLPGVYYMDPPDGGSVDPIEQLRRMSEDAERYRIARRKICAIGRDFHVLNLHPIAGPVEESAAAFDAAIDAARGKA